jgi:hypothetical protein
MTTAAGSHWLSRAIERLRRKLVFFAGDLRRLEAFPWVTWAVERRAVGFEEILAALPLIQYGDVGLHRERGYLSNLAIPGFMKHAWIHVEDGLERPEIVEAVSEGVLRRSPVYPMFSDYTIILTPAERAAVGEAERKGACKKAKQIVGATYDVHFEFDIERELAYYRGKKPDDARNHLRLGRKWMQRFHPAFSCTEVASYSWWHCREELGIYRATHRGRSVVLADGFLNRGWKIKWMSRSVTLDVARRLGLHEEGVSLIEDYLRKSPAVVRPPARAVPIAS